MSFNRYYWESYSEYKKRVRKTKISEKNFWNTHITHNQLKKILGWSESKIKKTLQPACIRHIKLFGKLVSYKIYKLEDVLKIEGKHD